MKVFTTLSVVLSLSFSVLGGASKPTLTTADAELLLLNMPDALKVKSVGGWPAVELLWSGRDFVFTQVRNRCPREGSGLIGNYTVDLRTGEIWLGVDKEEKVDSPRLRKLRDKFLSKRKQRSKPESKQQK